MRRTGVIIGMTEGTDQATARNIIDQLEARFPGVTFAVVSYAQSVTFEWDSPDDL